MEESRLAGDRELDQVALVARLQRETGSNAAEVIDRVIETVRGRAELRRLVKTLTAQGRLSRWILTALPIVLALALPLLSPGYLNPLLHRTRSHLYRPRVSGCVTRDKRAAESFACAVHC